MPVLALLCCCRSVRRGFSLLALTLLCLATPAIAQTTWTVNNTGDSGTGSGTGGDLRYALTHFGSGDTITFTATGTITLTSALPAINQNLTIQGPGPGLLTISGNSLYQVFAIDNGTVAISGLTISHGAGSGSGSTFGGGLINYGGTVTLTNCAFSYNTANYGGAIHNQSFMTIADSTFLDNVVAGSSGGGAIRSTGTDPSSFVVSDTTFRGNSSSGDGGAILLAAGTISNSTFISSQSGGFGGAVDGTPGPVVVTGSTFINNSASQWGGAVGCNTCTILNNTFALNQTVNAGGSALFMSDTGTAAHNTFYANTTETTNFSNTAGAVNAGYNGSTVNLNNNIFDGNVSNSGYGGIDNGGGGTVNSNYNVFWNNNGDCESCSAIVGATDASADPLMPLNFYGGMTKTFLPKATGGAICAGSAALAVDANSQKLTTDQRGFPFNYTYCTNGGVDAGSVQSNYQIVTTNADSNDGACTSALCSLRDAIAAAESAGGGDVGFSSGLNNQTITLGSRLEISGTVGVAGPGANLLSVSGNPSLSFNVFQVDSGAQAFLYGLTIENGGASTSGGISNAGTLTVNSSVVTGNQSGQYGAGIFNTGSLYVLDSSILNNKGEYGGGIWNNGGTAVLVESTLSGNQGVLYGGGIFNEAGSVSTQNVTVAGNWAGIGGPGIYNHSGATVTSANSIVTGNELGTSSSPGNYLDVTAASGFVDDGGNVIGYENTSNAAAPSSALTIGGLGYSGTSALETMLPMPGSPAICAGLVANVPFGIQADERGFPNDNTTYAGFTSSTPCVDAGAAQTNYTAVKFVQQPTNTSVNTVISPAPTVELVETNPSTNLTDVPSIAAPITLTYSGGAGAINGTLTQPTSAGVAAYGDLAPNTSLQNVTLATSVPVTTAGSGTTLTATSSNFNVVGPLAGYQVTAPATAFDGTAFNFTVTAVDANGSELLGATDPVKFSSTDGAAVLPGQSSLTGASGTFSATLNTSGSQIVVVTDANNSSISGTSNNIASSGPATQIEVTRYPTPVFQGTPSTGTITALDASGFPATYFNGLVSLTTSDPQAATNSIVTLVNGVSTFTATFFTAGSQSITASSAGLTSIPETGINVTARPGYVVNTSLDDNPAVPANCPVGGSAAMCTLRDAVAAVTSAGGGEITFDSTVFLPGNPATGNTIYLNYGTIALPSNAFLNGLTSGGSNLVTIDGNGSAEIFTIATGNTAEALANLNFAHGKSGAGSVVANAGALSVSNCTFSNNVGTVIGNTGSLAVTGSMFANNTTTSAGRPGGAAIDSVESTTTIVVNSSFLNNSAVGNGGAIEGFYSPLTVTGSTFSGNSTTDGNGGAIFTQTSNPTIIINSTFTGNSAYFAAGAIEAYDSKLEIYSSTIAGNSAHNQGGGVTEFNYSSSSTLTLTNSIVAGNSGNLFADIYQDYGSYTDGGGNLASNNSSGTSTINPQLAPLGNYGGLTQTMVPLPGSAAICAAALSGVLPGDTTDQRGYPLQPIGGYCAAGQVDSGAVQSNYTSIRFVQQPSDVNVNTAMSPAPTVQALETDTLLGSTDAVNGIPVTLTDLSGHMSGGSVTSSGGLATFGSLQFSQGYLHDTLSTPAITVTGTDTLPSLTSGTFNVLATATHFAVSAPGTANPGAPFTVTVTAEDASNNAVPNYTGTVQFSTSDTGTGVALPANYTFTSGTGGDNGSHTFANAVTLVTAGSQTVTATDTVTNSITGSATISVVTITPVFTWNPATTILVGDAGAGVLNASVNCTSCGTITYLAALNGGPASSITSTSGLAPGTYTIGAVFQPSSGEYNSIQRTSPLTVSNESLWIANSGGGTSELAGNGYPLSASAYSGANTAVAIDAAGNVWTVGTAQAQTTADATSGNNVLAVASATGIVKGLAISGPGIPSGTVVTGVSGTAISMSANATASETAALVTFTAPLEVTSKTGSLIFSQSGGGLSSPAALAIDGSGQAWIVNGNNSISVLNASGSPVSLTAYTGGQLSSPSSIAIDISGNLWIANSGSNSVTEVLGAAAPTVPLATGVANNSPASKP